MGECRYTNAVRERLGRGEFVASIEFVTPEASEPFESALAPIVELAQRIKGDPRFDTIAVTDRVRSDRDHDPVQVAARVGEASGKTPFVHLSGKDRGVAWLQNALRRTADGGLQNLLLVTGDRVKQEPGDRRVRYYDSVNMLAEARRTGEPFLLAAAVSPFKYREEELLNQYVKMAKKEHTGAAVFMTQVGWDMLKLKELMAWRRRRGLEAPLIMGMMLLTVARARYIRANKLAGIVVTDSLQALLEQEATLPDKGIGKAYHRLALQIVGLKRMGYAGFQLTGMHQFDKLDRLFHRIDTLERELPTEAAWWEAWWEALRGPEGRPASTAPRPYYLYRELMDPGGCGVPVDRLTPVDLPAGDTRSPEFKTFRSMDRVHRLAFEDRSPGALILEPLARLASRGSALEHGLQWMEHRIKHPLVGCEACGFCRLPYTVYMCPETCPKGLANGPCGGTSDNTCEFGDRECVHNAKYRVAKAAGRLDDLEMNLIPTVDELTRGTCSWTNHFRGESPRVTRLDETRLKGAVQ